MQKITIVNTGGTFNKRYNPLNGELIVDKTSSALKDIAQKWLHTFDESIDIIGKDSLDIDDSDRLEILETIKKATNHKIIIIHGTDTMDITAQYLDNANLEKQIILTGAMIPYSINPVEATANLASAFGYISAIDRDGVYISMNGVIGDYVDVVKDREIGKFIKNKPIISNQKL